MEIKETNVTPVTPIGQASLILVTTNIDKIDRVKASLAELRAKYKDVAYAVTTTEGMSAAKAARLDIREPRYAVAAAAKAAKDPLNALKRDIDADANAIVAELVELEIPIHEQIKVEEERVAAEKEAKKKAKAEADAKVQQRLDGLRDSAIKAVGMSAADIDTARTELSTLELTPDEFGERTGEALQLKMRALETLDTLHASAVNREASEAQAAAERLELERMRSEQAERERTERAAREAAAQKEQAERDEANRKAAEKLAAERAAFAQEQATARAALKAEADALAAKQARQAELERAEQRRKDDIAAAERKAEEDRAAAARAELERKDRETAAAEQKRLDDEATANDRMAAEKRAAEEAAHHADQRGRDAWCVLLSALEGMVNEAQPLGIDRQTYQSALAAIKLATGEKTSASRKAVSHCCAPTRPARKSGEVDKDRLDMLEAKYG